MKELSIISIRRHFQSNNRQSFEILNNVVFFFFFFFFFFSIIFIMRQTLTISRLIAVLYDIVMEPMQCGAKHIVMRTTPCATLT